MGVWMDHAEAWLITPGESVEKMRNIKSPFQGRLRVDGEESSGTRLGNYRSTNNEYNKHQQEQGQLNTFFNRLSKEVEPYTDMLLFGPTHAATEFSHHLSSLQTFKNKNISVRITDYLTPNQMVEIVRKFFVMT